MAPNPRRASAPDPVWPALSERIAEVAQRAYDHEMAYRTELERRNALVIEAFDRGLVSGKVLAEAAKISVTSLYRIVADAG